MFHMIALEQTFVNNSLQKIFLLLLPFQIESILSVIYISLLNISLCAYRLHTAERKIDTKVRNMGH